MGLDSALGLSLAVRACPSPQHQRSTRVAGWQAGALPLLVQIPVLPPTLTLKKYHRLPRTYSSCALKPFELSMPWSRHPSAQPGQRCRLARMHAAGGSRCSSTVRAAQHT